MNCPVCGADSRVVDSWHVGATMLRKRVCCGCGATWETRERRCVLEAHERNSKRHKWERAAMREEATS